MKKEKEIQKKIQEQFEKPEVPYEVWAAQHGIVTEAPEIVECPVLQPAENVGGGGAPHVGKKKLLAICLPACSLFVVLAVLLACLLPKSSSTPKIYGENDMTRMEIELDEIKEREEIYLFDMSNVVRIETVHKDVLTGSNSQVLLYTIRNCLLSVENGDSYDGFYVTYRIRLYSHYEFFSSENFTNLEHNTSIQGKTVRYEIRDIDQTTAYAGFSDGTYEYFIEAVGYENVTVLNEQNFLNLLDKILI